MVCQVKYLSSAGIQQREVKGLDALAKAFPSSWLVYASLNAFPPKSAPIEIDVLVAMDDRIVLLELKDWNGRLTAKGDLWIHAGKRHRSPVILGNEKAKKIKGIITQNIPSLRGVYVDSRVVLTATSTRDALPDDEKPHVLTLEEAKLLGDRKERNRLIGTAHLIPVRPNMLVKDFEKLFGNGSYFKPLKMSWDGYEVTDEDFYVHRGDAWHEHRAQLKREERVKALLRLWRFDKLPVGLNEPGRRQLIADRELKTVAYLGEQGSWMAERGILKQVGTPPEEVLTEHHQLVMLPSGATTLRRYLALHGADVIAEQRLDIMHTLASMVAELHSHGVSHRDIGDEAIWLSAPTSMSLTGFFSAQLPDEKSVSDFLDVLGTYARPEPDWSGTVPTAKERDVYSLGILMRDLLELEGDSAALPAGWDEVAGRALAAPGERYADARGLAEALGELRTPSGPTVDQSRLDGFETMDIPYVRFVASGAPKSGAHSTRYESGTAADRVVVKVWNGMVRGDSSRDHALLSMLEAAAALKAVSFSGTAPVVASGLSQIGPFVVTKWVEGTTLEEFTEPGVPTQLDVLDGLVRSVDGLHARGLSHGDLHPGNVIVGPDHSVVLIDLLDVSMVGTGRIRSTAWVPGDHERRTEQQIDRYSVCRMVALRAETAGTEEMDRIAAAARAEMERQSIETLAPVAEAIDLERRRMVQPPVRNFVLSSPILPARALDTDDGHVWVKAFRTSNGMDVFWVTGLNGRILLRIDGAKVDGVEFVDAKLVELGQGARVPARISLVTGPEQGVHELAAYLREHVTVEEYRISEIVEEEEPDWDSGEAAPEPDLADLDAEEPVLVSPLPLLAFNVARMWLRASEIEEETVLQVRVDRRLPDVGTAAVYQYAAPQPLEFEDDDTVEVRLGGMHGKRVGLLDVSHCDDKRIAVRDLRFPVVEGEFLSLLDRRDRVSKERRRRAVERITRRASVIPGLIDYFDPGIDAPEMSFDTAVTDETLLGYGLNEGQREAFRSLLGTGPVGLLQGPPGSGKTRFIASFAHWLLTEGGARRVLIASQSHEAVNNVLEEVLRTYRKHGGHADMLRVGSRGATQRVRPYQARSLRDRYRVRFENGIKTRVGHAAGAAGIPRAFASDVVDVDQRLGRILRSIELVVASLEIETAREAAIRLEARLRTLLRAFSGGAGALLEREVEVRPGDAAAVVEEAYAAVLAKHPKSSPGDLATTRRLIALANDWQATLATGHRNFDEFLAKTRRVVAGTCVGLGQSQIRLEEGVFDWVIVDEAARCTSGELAVPLQLGSRVILVGDQRQLRPMLDYAVRKGLRKEFRGLDRVLVKSDFERAFESPYGRRNACVLHEQYRMTPVISDLVSSIFYAPHGVELKPSPAREPDKAFARLPGDIALPVVWYDTSAMPDAEERDRNMGRDIWNEAEIGTVLALLQRLARETTLVDELSKRAEPAIGVICMYSEQKRRIEREWSQLHFSEAFRRIVTIDTVDAYQGKENSIVIVTLVRANDDRLPGHVGRETRCNVAMSRAKERLYIVGNADMWSDPKCESPMRSVFRKVSAMKGEGGDVKPAGRIGQ
jgi:tRNA A-37 threonylcarbamoyl transferase component Bud32